VRAHRLGPVGRAVFLVDVDQVDVGGDVEFARAELAHADDPELDRLAGRVARHAVAPVQVAPRLGQGAVERDLGEVGHRDRHVLHRRLPLDVEHGQALEHELARHAQGAGEAAAALLEALDRGRDRVAARQARCQQRQLGFVAPAHALHEAAVAGPRLGGARPAGSRGHGAGRPGTHGAKRGLC
jgi:hypothetical protein